MNIYSRSKIIKYQFFISAALGFRFEHRVSNLVSQNFKGKKGQFYHESFTTFMVLFASLQGDLNARKPT